MRSPLFFRERGSRMGRIISVANQKGGVGKTTSTISLAASLAYLGSKVLIIDSDPQGNATSGLGVQKTDLEADVYDVLVNQMPLKEIIVPSSRENLMIAPSTIQLAGAEIELTNQQRREQRLKEAVAPIREDYDYIFIDCPPSLGHLTMNAFTASDTVLIPVQCEYYALEGLSQLMNTITMVRKHFNPQLKLEGVLLTMYDPRTNLSQEVRDDVVRYFREKVYQTLIPRNVRLSEAPSYGQAIIDYDPKSKGAQVYLDLAKEVLANG